MATGIESKGGVPSHNSCAVDRLEPPDTLSRSIARRKKDQKNPQGKQDPITNLLSTTHDIPPYSISRSPLQATVFIKKMANKWVGINTFFLQGPLPKLHFQPPLPPRFSADINHIKMTAAPGLQM
jgi:hypothetical protein